MNKRQLLKVLYGFSLSDHIGDAFESLIPIMEYVGIDPWEVNEDGALLEAVEKLQKAEKVETK